ncbi:uncharacterized protein LOC127278594 [Leptopilina boulardi]|uniref:uncharacterized protein LOC127278594 n=1 Tax=Leptopilina boulardi TaxID=63433 RepID=UPI0021F636CE|nr:uncharacterized protein LOC127278594 [Leptopilina boulardi]XP_051156350.1 uncharacterized protein LOC127278594 [Leptopilina boulardi]
MTDGGPDENPCYAKVIAQAINDFKKYDLDAMFKITNSPGRSCYNRVERRMAPISRELSALILPHDHYGTHLGNGSKTIDVDLELKNFEFAGKALAEVWSSMVIDQYPVTAEYVSPDCIASDPEPVSPEWFNTHVQESQYFLQIVKCIDRDCCGDWRSSLKDVLPLSNRFLPSPFPLHRTNLGTLEIPSPKDNNVTKHSFHDLCLNQAIAIKPVTANGFKVPHDYYCPSVRDQV